LKWCSRHFSEHAVNLTIGSFVSIAFDVTVILDGGHDSTAASTYPLLDPAGDRPNFRSKGSVTIGNDVWIGLGVTILSGVTIGDGAVIGARAVVAKDVEPYSVVVGNPARVVKRRFSDDVVQRLLQIKWWDWEAEEIVRRSREITDDPEVKLLRQSFPCDNCEKQGPGAIKTW
jgi:virginiamycin A acetyltransferase